MEFRRHATRSAGDYGRIAGRSHPTRVRMPDWYTNTATQKMPPAQPGPVSRVVLYTRSGCHLCDDAQSTLERCGVTPELVDIDSTPELLSRFDTCVPVVEIDGRIRFRGAVNEVLLQRILRRSAGR